MAGDFEVAVPDDEGDAFVEAMTRSDDFSTPDEQESSSNSTNVMIEAGAGSAIESGTALTGALAGGKLGAMTGNPFAAAGGALVGLVGGSFAGSEIREAVGIRSPEQFDPEDRASAYFGASLGGAAGGGIGLYSVARTGLRYGNTSMVGRYTNQVMDTVSTRPLYSAASTVMPSTWAATGAAGAETLAPGNTPVRIAAEFAGGLSNPSQWVQPFVEKGIDKLRVVVASRRTGALDPIAARVAVAAMQDFKEDPVAVARIAKELAKSYNLTFAQVTGSDAFIAIERDLAKHNEAFARGSKQKAIAAFDVMRANIQILAATGDPKNLKLIAEARNDYFTGIWESRIKKATEESIQAISKFKKDSPEAEKALSEELMLRIGGVEKEANEIEKQLWSNFKRKVPMPATNFMNTIDAIRAEASKEGGIKFLQAEIREHFEKLEAQAFEHNSLTLLPKGRNNVVSDSTTLKEFRSTLLDAARRESLPGGSRGLDERYSRIAAAILRDMDQTLAGMGDDTYDTARAFTKSIHDTFDRTFFGQATALGKWGDVMSSGTVVRRALAPQDIQADINLEDLTEAASFLYSKGMGTDEAINFTTDAQDRIFRIVVAGATGTLTGKVNPERVRQYIEKHPQLFKRFSEVKTQLERAISTSEGLAALEAVHKRTDNLIGKRSAFSQIANEGSVSYATRVLTSTENREKQMINMFNLAKRGAPDKGITPQMGVESARASIINAAINASQRNGVLDLTVFRNFMFSSKVVGQKAPMQVMIEQGVIDPQHAENLKKMFSVYDNVQKWSRQGSALEVQSDVSEEMLVFAAKVAASKMTSIATRAIGTGGSADLIIHGNVAKLTERWVSKIPVGKMKDTMVRLASDPEMLADLLIRHKDPKLAASQARRFHAWAVQSGLTVEEEITRPERPQSQQMSTRPNPRNTQ
jgi:hypothetical protein